MKINNVRTKSDIMKISGTNRSSIFTFLALFKKIGLITFHKNSRGCGHIVKLTPKGRIVQELFYKVKTILDGGHDEYQDKF